MQGNDLDNAPTQRYFVVSRAVLHRLESVQETGGFLRKVFNRRTIWAPDLGVLSELWRFSQRQGVRLELLFVGDDVKDADDLWEVIDRSASNPFSVWMSFSNHQEIVDALPYRPDVLGVIDVPEWTSLYGGRGLSVDGGLR